MKCKGCGKRASLEHRYSCARWALMDEIDRLLFSAHRDQNNSLLIRTELSAKTMNTLRQLRENIDLDDDVQASELKREVDRACP